MERSDYIELKTLTNNGKYIGESVIRVFDAIKDTKSYEDDKYNCDVSFKSIFYDINANYNAIQNIYNAVQNDYIKSSTFKHLYEMIREYYLLTEEFKRTIFKDLQELKNRMKNNTSTDIFQLSGNLQYLETETYRTKTGSQSEYIAKLAEIQGILLNLKQSMNVEIQNNFKLDNSTSDEVGLQCFTLFYGTFSYISTSFFLLEEYSDLVGYYYENGNFNKYNEYFNLLQNNFRNFKEYLTQRADKIVPQSFIDHVINASSVYTSFVESEMKEKILKRTELLNRIKNQISDMELPLIKDTPPKLISKPSFQDSLITTPMKKWEKGSKVQYAIQYRDKNNYSVIGEWSDPITVSVKANPFLTIPVDPYQRTRIVFRKFNNEKPEVIGILENNYQTQLRDIDRDLYNAALDFDEDTAMNETTILINNGASASAIFEKGRQLIHAAAESGNTKIPMKFLLDGDLIDINLKDNDGYAPIHIAVERGYKNFLKMLMEHNANINAKTYLEKFTPLHIAAYKGFKSIVDILLGSSKINNNARDINDFTPLHYAVFGGLPTIQSLMLNERTDVSMKSRTNLTPLHLSAIKNSPDIAEALLSNIEADINSQALGNLTPLHFAIICENLEMVKFLLLQNGINVNAKTIHGWTPLHFAIAVKNKNIIFELLKNDDVDVNSTAEGNIAPIHLAVQVGDENTIEKLLERKSLVHMKTNNEFTVLHFAAVWDKKQIISLLLRNGIDIDVKNINGSTPLYLATIKGHLDTIKLLIENGAWVNAKNQNGQTPIYFAIKYGYINVVKYLVENNGDVNAEDNLTISPLHLAAKYNQLEIAKYLIEKGALIRYWDMDGVTPFYTAVLEDHSEMVKLLLEKGSDTLNYQTKHESPLTFAAAHGKLEVLKYLSTNPKFDLNKTGEHKNTLLHYASGNGHLSVVKFLIEKGANVNAANTFKDYPLHWAVSNGLLEVTKCLIENNADMNVKNIYGNTPLQKASKWGHLSIVKDLINRGANTSHKNNNNETALDIAINRNHYDVVKLLKSVTYNSRMRRDVMQSSRNSLLDRNFKSTENNFQFNDKANKITNWMNSSSNLISFENVKNSQSTQNLLTQYDVNGTIFLSDVLLRKATGNQYVPVINVSDNIIESRSNALNITEEFEKILKKATKKLGILRKDLDFNFFKLYKDVDDQLAKGDSSAIQKLLFSAVNDASKKNDKLRSFLKIHIDKILNNKTEIEPKIN